MQEVLIDEIPDLVRQLELLALSTNGNEYVFRGHRNSDWRLESTFSRHSTSILPEYAGLALEQLLTRYADGLARIGDRRMLEMGRRGKLELARHSGIPSPLVDFSRSPFVALWFAFNGVRGSVETGSSAAIYAFDWNMAGVAFADFCESRQMAAWIEHRFERLPMDLFRWEFPQLFENGYPAILKFIPLAASWNVRMNRQQGCFLYDALDYKELACRDLEMLLTEHPSFSKFDGLLTKFIIPHKLASNVFRYLEIIGVSGAQLFPDETGVVADVFNTFNYNPRAQSWDIPSD